MKKSIKRMISMFLAAVMCMAMCLTGFAAGECSVTVENSIGGVSYSIYKLFDATYTTVGEGDDAETAVSYTFDATNTTLEALVNDSGSPFTATLSADRTVYVVTLNESASDTDVATWLNSNATDLAAAGTLAGDDITGNGGSISWNELDAGYYLIVPSSSTLTPTLISVTTAAPNGVIMDKNQIPGSANSFTKTEDSASYSIGETVTYTVTSYVPTYDGEHEVVSYTFVDTLGAGITFDSITSITITGTGSDGNVTIPLTENTDYTVSQGTDNNGNVTITISYTIAEITGYPADANITIIYTATVNDAADDTNITNDVAMSWIRADGTDPKDDEEIPEDQKTEAYTYGFDLKKTDGTDALDGAVFTLTDESGTQIRFIYQAATGEQTTGTYEVYDGSQTSLQEGQTPVNTITVGEANIWGLGEGTYTLTEIEAPAGYNMLTDSVTITIAETETGWTVTVDSDSENASSGTITDEGVSGDMPTVTVANSAGSTLPGTGGIGTTIFYVVGTLLVLAAAALVVAKMRLGKTE